MSSIRGRLAQYNILSKEQQLNQYLVPTFLLTQASLITMLSQNSALILKPIVGMSFIEIFNIHGLYKVNMNETEHIFSNENEVYTFIQQHKSHQNYVIQPIHPTLSNSNPRFQCLVTLHKINDFQEISTCTKKHFIEEALYYSHLSKMEEIAKLASVTLQKFYAACEAIVLEISIDVNGTILIHDSYLHFPISKWSQYQLIKSSMPPTDLLTDQTFQSYLNKYKTVFMKPCNGQHGKGIIKITRNKSFLYNLYEVHIGRTKWVKEGFNELNQFIHNHLNFNESYVIQQGIPLATIENNVFDVRVVLQKVDESWRVSGKAVKLAGDGFIITNAAKEIIPLPKALKQSTIPLVYHEQLDKRMNELCMNAAIALDSLQTYKEIGFDVGLTNRGEISIIEGNYCSDISMFHLLEDRAMYKTILSNRGLVNQPSE